MQLYSIILWLIAAVVSAVLFCIAVVIFCLTFPFDRNGVVLHLYSSAWAYFLIWSNPLWKLKYEGRDKIKFRRPYVIIANHQSMMDIAAVFGLFRPFKWLAKSSAFNIPFIGWNMILNRYVRLNKKSPKSRGDAINKCRSWLRKGVSILIFPEGTRGLSGELQPFHMGAFNLAVEEKVDLVPVVIGGTGDILPKGTPIFSNRYKGSVTVQVLEPFRCSEGEFSDAKELLAAAKARMQSQLDRINALSS